MSLDVSFYQVKECPHCGGPISQECVFEINITHNLMKMATEAGFADQLWGYDKRVRTANDLLPHLQAGLSKLQANPEYFKQFDASNGWGTYKTFVPQIEDLIEVCTDYPSAILEYSR